MKKIIYLIFLLIPLNGFSNDPCSQGDDALEKMAYQEAIVFYKICLEKSETTAAMERLAAAYQLIANYEKAAEWYGKAATNNDFSN